MKKYTISSNGIVVRFTADQVSRKSRSRLIEELIQLRNAESLSTEEFLTRHNLNKGTFTLLSDYYPTVGDLVSVKDEQLLSIRNFGQRRLYFLREALRKEGY